MFSRLEKNLFRVIITSPVVGRLDWLDWVTISVSRSLTRIDRNSIPSIRRAQQLAAENTPRKSSSFHVSWYECVRKWGHSTHVDGGCVPLLSLSHSHLAGFPRIKCSLYVVIWPSGVSSCSLFHAEVLLLSCSVQFACSAGHYNIHNIDRCPFKVLLLSARCIIRFGWKRKSFW